MSEPVVIGGKQFDQHVLFYGDGSAMMSPNVFKQVNGLTITTAQPIWTPAAGKRFRLMGYHLSITIAGGNIQLRDGAGGTVIATIPIVLAVGGFPMQLGNGILSGAADRV